MRKIIVILLFMLSLHANESSYELGKGMQVASLPFYIGGYLSFDYRNMGNEKRYRADDLAVLGYGNYGKFSYMAEFEYKGFYAETYKGDKKSIQKDSKIHSERVYIDYNFDENYIFRIGKYNSPVGFWNLLPVNVLRQTSSNPISTEIIFPKFTTGAGASYESFDEGEVKINLMLQNNEDLDDEYNNYKINEHYAVGVLYEEDAYSIKLNGGYFHMLDFNIIQNKLYYFLLSAKYDMEKYQLMGEIGAQYSEAEITTPYAGYIQGLYRFTEQHIGAIRVEAYDNNVNKKNDDIAVFSYTYRPSYPIAIKSEYQFHSISEENQFLFSISVLF